MDVEGCALPEDRRYDLENDVWIRQLDDGGIAEVGVTASIAAFAGRFHALSFRPVEGRIARGRSVATVESTRYTGAVRLPVDGTIAARNDEVLRRPRWLNDDPYGRGWVVRLREVDPAEVMRWTREAQDVREALRQRIAELRIRCYPAVPDAELYEIGVECSAILARVDQEVARLEPEGVLLLVTDDPTSPIELVRWSDRTGHAILAHRRDGGLEHFLLRRERDPRPRRPAPRV